jgi:hypothetical protein
MHPLSLILVWACAGSPSAQARVDPDPHAVGCEQDHWGYTQPLLDFRSRTDCNTAGMRLVQQPPHVYMTWRCIEDPKKDSLFDDDPQPGAFARVWRWLFG